MKVVAPPWRFFPTQGEKHPKPLRANSERLPHRRCRLPHRRWLLYRHRNRRLMRRGAQRPRHRHAIVPRRHSRRVPVHNIAGTQPRRQGQQQQRANPRAQSALSCGQAERQQQGKRQSARRKPSRPTFAIRRNTPRNSRNRDGRAACRACLPCSKVRRARHNARHGGCLRRRCATQADHVRAGRCIAQRKRNGCAR